MPEAPTSVPEMIRARLSSANPVEAAARPVNEFRSEITTGMSAPPIGITMNTPNASEPTRYTASRPGPPPSSVMAPDTRIAITIAALTKRVQAPAIAFSEITPCSLPHAIALPLNDTEPISTPSSSTSEAPWGAS